MSWNYRVTKLTIQGEECYEIREVHYNEDGSVKSWTEEPAKPFGNSKEELKEVLNKMQKAFDLPLLDLD
jgi:hypothetical protein